MALSALVEVFEVMAIDAPNPRALKDTYVGHLKLMGLSPKTLKLVEKVLIKVCELIEKDKTGRWGV